MEKYTIGQIAKQTGITVEAVRFYEKQGLIDEPPRSQAGYRLYPVEVVDRIRFIQKAKSVGFSLKDINELLDLRASEQVNSCDEINRRARLKIDEITDKIEELMRMKTTLEQMASCCNTKHPDCAIIDALGS